MTTRMRWLPLFAAMLPWATPAAAIGALPVAAAATATPCGQQDDARLQLKASIEPPTAKPGDSVTLVLTATVAAGYHAYGTLEPTNIPVSLEPKKLQLGGLLAKGPPVIPPGDKHTAFGIESFPLPNTFRVTQRLTVPDGAEGGEVTVRGELEYQVCDENMCLPPDAAAFAAKLLVLAPAAPQDDGKLRLVATFEPAAAKPGDTVTLVLTATVIAGYHAYGTEEKTNIPVAFDPEKQQFAGLAPVGAAVVPPGEKHQAFGMDTYPLPNTFRVTQALKVPTDAEAGDVAVRGELDYQVCDENSCDPPDAARYSAKLTVVAGAPPQGKQQEPEAAPMPLPGLGGGGRLTLKAAFQPATARAGEPVMLLLTATVEDGFHAYGSKETGNIPVSLDTGRLQLGPLQLAGPVEIPPGEAHEVLGNTSYPLPAEFEVKVRLMVPAGTPDGEVAVQGELGYQVCDESSCEQPEVAPFAAKLVIGKGGPLLSGTTPQPDRRKPVQASSNNGASGPLLQPKFPEIGGGGDVKGSLWSLILLCIGGGLIALVMPCTYPMIPITFSFFTKQADARHGKVLPLALAYGAGIVLIFIVIGVAVGEVIIPFATHWITNIVIGGAFVVFAASLFGFITLQPPGWLTNAAGRAGATGGLLGVFLMGATLVVTSFTCTAPIVGSLLASVAVAGRGRVALGMAVFGLTMAAPFMVLAMLPGRVKALPRSGEWMNTLKVSLGFIELAAALKFLSNVDVSLGLGWCPREGFLMLWAFVFVLLALFLFGLMRHRGEAVVGPSATRNSFGIASLAFAFYCMFGAMGFPLDQVMTAFEPPYRLRPLQEHEIVVDNHEAAMDLARREGKYVLINFTGFT